MIQLPCRQKGGGPLLGAKGPHQCGPFGEWPDEDDGQDDGEQHEDQDHADH